MPVLVRCPAAADLLMLHGGDQRYPAGAPGGDPQLWSASRRKAWTTVSRSLVCHIGGIDARR